jgi:hypothetical protein
VARGSLTSLHPPSLSPAGVAEIGAAQDAAPHAPAEVLSSTSDVGETPLGVSVWRATLQDRGGQVGGERSSEKAFAPRSPVRADFGFIAIARNDAIGNS